MAETIKDGAGFPKLLNDEEIIPLYVSKGATFEEALDYAVSGCAEARMPNRDTYTSGGAYINFAAAVEMTLRNGRMKSTATGRSAWKRAIPARLKHGNSSGMRTGSSTCCSCAPRSSSST
mgnify:CR=1 FL=1